MSEKVVVLRTGKTGENLAVIEALEDLLADARAGQLHRLVIVGINDNTGDSHFVSHNAVDTTMLGALGAMLFKLQRKWTGEEDEQ